MFTEGFVGWGKLDRMIIILIGSIGLSVLKIVYSGFLIGV
jgi:hypothetical protein